MNDINNTDTGSSAPQLSANDSWNVVRDSGRRGTGNWNAYDLGLEPIYAAAEKWREAVKGVDYPWLCWNMDDEWCKVQQRLVLDMGWVPVVGWDPNSCPETRTILPGAIAIDFNADLQFQALWSHFPLEFAFLWTDRLAFWHSDLLVRTPLLKEFAEKFKNLPDKEMYAVKCTLGWTGFLKTKKHRYWELLGCTTKGASQHQFETGCGWWRHFYDHPNTPVDDAANRRKYYYDSGVGIMYWKNHCGGVVHDISEKQIMEGHCTQIGNKNYQKAGSKTEELALNFDLTRVAKQLGLEKYL